MDGRTLGMPGVPGTAVLFEGGGRSWGAYMQNGWLDGRYTNKKEDIDLIAFFSIPYLRQSTGQSAGHA